MRPGPPAEASEAARAPAQAYLGERLRLAAGQGRESELLWLLRRGADPLLADAAGFRALDAAVFSGSAGCLALALPFSGLARGGPELNALLLMAASHCQAGCVAELLVWADPLSCGPDGRTALHEAALQGSLACSELLLPRSDPDAADRSGANALMLATAARGHGRDATIGLLLGACDLGARDALGRTALDHALARGASWAALAIAGEAARREAAAIGLSLSSAPAAPATKRAL